MSSTHASAHRPGNLLLELVAALLTPIFLGVAQGDVALARLAAIETINDYRARNGIDLIAIAQIIACGLAAVASLGQSMAEDLSVAATLRLRGNAVSLNRHADRNRQILQAPLPEPDAEPAPHLEPASPRPRPQPQPARQDPSTQRLWATVMAQEAADITASLPHLPPAERHAASIRATALTSAANDLFGTAPSPS
jgi:hypothetical protein